MACEYAWDWYPDVSENLPLPVGTTHTHTIANTTIPTTSTFRQCLHHHTTTKTKCYIEPGLLRLLLSSFSGQWSIYHWPIGIRMGHCFTFVAPFAALVPAHTVDAAHLTSQRQLLLKELYSKIVVAILRFSLLSQTFIVNTEMCYLINSKTRKADSPKFSVAMRKTTTTQNKKQQKLILPNPVLWQPFSKVRWNHSYIACQVKN